MADGSYTKIFCTNVNGRYILMSRRLKKIEESLDPKIFFRCHKSFVVNINYVKEIKFDSPLYLIMNNKKKIKLSHRKKLKLKEFLKRRYLIV